MARPRRPDVRAIAAEIVRRIQAEDGRPCHIVRLSDPPTPRERLQLLAARLRGTPIAIMPQRCETVAEWLQRYAGLDDRQSRKRPHGAQGGPTGATFARDGAHGVDLCEQRT
jgi:hypothetical protein